MKLLLTVALTAATAFAAASLSLIDAVKSGERSTALDMIAKKSADVNAAESDGSTALLWAATNNDTDVATRLIKAGAKPNVRNSLGATPLLEAAFNGNTDIVKALLDAGADPNAAGPDGETPLMLVARTPKADATKLLLDKGANPNAKESQRGQTALMWAAASSHNAVMRELLNHGAEPDLASDKDLMTPLISGEPRAQPRSPGGMTALMFSVREGCLDCVKALLEHNAQINKADPEGVTPLILALSNNRFDVAKYLIENNATINRWDWWGRTPLYLAVDYNTLPHGGRPDQPALDVTLPIDLVKLLLDKGANPNVQTKTAVPMRATGNDRGLDRMLQPGTTPLLRAAKAFDADSVKLLLEHGADITLPNAAGWTPMVAAAGLGSVDADTRGYYVTSDVQQRSIATLELLLAKGADINSTGGPNQGTALQGAAFWGWNDVVDYLLKHGANINQADARGYTAVDYAMGRAEGNSRGGQRTDVHLETADFIKSKGGVEGTPVRRPAPAGAKGAAPAKGAAR